MTTSRKAALLDQSSTIDHQDFAGYIVTTLEQIEQCRYHVRGTSQAAKRSRAHQPFPLVGTVVLRNQHRPWSNRVDSDFGGQASRQYLGQHDDSGFADGMGRKAGPGFEAGQV